MARSNVSFSQFNPGSLQPAGQPSRQPYGVSSGDLSQSFIVQTPMLGADGKTYVQQVIENPDGTKSQPTFITASPDGGTIKFSQAPNGQWTEGQWTPKTFGETVFGDKKLMAFLAIAGGVGAYAAASGAAGGAGGAGLGGGTGATPGVVPGGVSGTSGLAGAGAASQVANQLGGGASDPSVNPINSDANANYSDAATGDYSGGLPPVPPGGPNESWWSQVRDIVASNPNLLTGGIGAIIGALANKDDFTSTTTQTTTIDPAIAAYRDQVLGRLGSFGDPNNVPTAPRGATNTSPTGLQASMMNFGGGTQGRASNMLFNPDGGSGGSVPQLPGWNMMGVAGGGSMSSGLAGAAPSGSGLRHYGDAGAQFGSGTIQPFNSTLHAGGTQGFDMAGNQPFTAEPLGQRAMTQQAPGGNSPTLFRPGEQYSGPTSYQAANNPLAGENNPYLSSLLDSARQDMQKYYQNQIAPKFASGSSFGSSGLGFAEVLARDNEAKRFADVATNLRFQDHNLRATLGEQQANRMDQASQFGINTGRNIWNDTEAQRQFDLGHASTLWNNEELARQFNLGHERNLFNDAERARQDRMRLALDGMIGAPGNTTQTTSQTAQGNPWLGAFGGFLAGSNLWKT